MRISVPCPWNSPRRWTRRAMLGAACAGGALVLKSRQVRSYAANEQLQIGVVGVGGRGAGFIAPEGWSSVRQQIGGRIAALCDVNRQRAGDAFERYPDVPAYEDFREMIDQMGSRLDGLIVSTPDHTHAAPSASGLRAGLHVFCEKGLTRTIQEARVLAELTAANGCSTQMGNQAGYNERVVEHVWGETIGELQTVWMWGGGGAGPRPRPSNGHSVPPSLNWDLWLGPAADRPYHPAWMRWQTWRDFASGHPGMWGSHLWATLFKALKLETLWPIDQQPPAAGSQTIQVTAECSEVPEATFPRWRVVHWDIPARMGMPPIRVTWFGGGGEAERRRRSAIAELLREHPQWAAADDERWSSWTGNLWIGTDGLMYTFGHGCSVVQMLPEAEFRGVGSAPQVLPRPLPGKFLRGWAQGMTNGPRPVGCFNQFSGPFTEWCLLANVAARFPGERLEFDPVGCRIVNHDQADQEIRPPYRNGWTL